MKTRIARIIATMAMMVAATIASSTASATTVVMNHQGRLFDANMNPVNGTLSVLFVLYLDATSNSPILGDEQNVTFTDGYYSVVLGSTLGFDADLLGKAQFLGIRIDTDPEMSPRQVIGSVPRAALATTASNLACSGCVTASAIAPGALSHSHAATVFLAEGQAVGDGRTGTDARADCPTSAVTGGACPDSDGTLISSLFVPGGYVCRYTQVPAGGVVKAQAMCLSISTTSLP